jgi:hypothetical protein
MLAIRTRKQKFSLPWEWSVFLLAVIIVALSLNNYIDNKYYHFLGPDLAIYSASADYLIMGGQLDPFTGSGYEQELMLHALRWGLPSCVAMTGKILGIPTASALFPLVLILLSSAIFSITLIFSDVFKISGNSWKTIAAIGMLFNASLLFFISNEFYPHVIGIAFTSLTAAILMQWAQFGRPDKIASFFIISIILASLIATCSEMAMVTICVISGFCILSLIKGELKPTDLVLLLTIPAAFIIIFPLAFKIMTFTMENIKRECGRIFPAELVLALRYHRSH